jgi:hypothetical protein
MLLKLLIVTLVLLPAQEKCGITILLETCQYDRFEFLNILESVSYVVSHRRESAISNLHSACQDSRQTILFYTGVYFSSPCHADTWIIPRPNTSQLTL